MGVLGYGTLCLWLGWFFYPSHGSDWRSVWGGRLLVPSGPGFFGRNIVASEDKFHAAAVNDTSQELKFKYVVHIPSEELLGEVHVVGRIHN